jgi:hypothetical protein
MKEATLQLRDPDTLAPMRDQVLCTPLTFDVPELGMELSSMSETPAGLLVASDIREHATSQAEKVYKLFLILGVGPKAAEAAGFPVYKGDVLLKDDHYRHDTNVPGGAGIWVMSVEAFVCRCGHIEVVDEPVDESN